MSLPAFRIHKTDPDAEQRHASQAQISVLQCQTVMPFLVLRLPGF